MIEAAIHADHKSSKPPRIRYHTAHQFEGGAAISQQTDAPFQPDHVPQEECERDHAGDALEKIAPVAHIAIRTHIAASRRNDIDANEGVHDKGREDDRNLEQVLIGHGLEEMTEGIIRRNRPGERIVRDHMEAEEDAEWQNATDRLQLLEEVDASS